MPYDRPSPFPAAIVASASTSQGSATTAGVQARSRCLRAAGSGTLRKRYED